MVEPEPSTLAALVTTGLERHGDRPFLADPDGRVVRYDEAAATVRSLRGLLRATGLRPGDRLALLGGNSANWALVYLAAVTSGIVIVPILADFPPAAVHNILNMSGARAAFVAASSLDRIQGGPFPHLDTIFLLDDFSRLDQGRIRHIVSQLRSTLEALRANAQAYLEEHVLPLRGDPVTPAPDDLAAIVYTSGTTGSSKGVMLSQRNLVADVLDAVRYVEVTPQDRLLTLLPLAHTYACTCGFLGPMTGGAAIHFMGQKPSPRALLAAFADVRPTLVFAVPLVIEKIFRKRVLPTVDRSFLLRRLARFSRARRGIYRRAVRSLLKAFGGELRQMGFGGAPLDPEVEQFLREGGFPYFVGYGMTECAPLIAGCRPEETRPGSCGYPVASIDLRIADPDRATGIGEVQVRGPMVTSGYFRNAEATQELFTEDGWLRTGDLGRQDEDGFLYLKGRTRNIILGPNGENVFPEEIEQLLARSPYVLECLVVGREGRIVALIVPDVDALSAGLDLYELDQKEVRRRTDATFADLVGEVNRQLPAFSRIASCELQEQEFEKTPTAKIKRYLYAS